MLKRAAILALALSSAVPATASAQVTPERAASLQLQIQDWLKSSLGDKLFERPVITVAPAGDHFELKTSLGPDAPTLTGTMREAGNGRWAIDNLAIPSPSTFKYQLPADPKSGKPAQPVTTTVTIGKQQSSMLVDPTFATPTTSTSSYGDINFTSQLASGAQISHIDSGNGTMTITPTAAGKVNFTSDSAIAGYSVKQDEGPGKKPSTIRLGSASVKLNMTDVTRQRAAELISVLGRIGQLPGRTSATGTRNAVSLDAETATALAAALTDLASGGSFDERASDIAVTVNGIDALMKQVGLGLTMKSDNGKLQGQLPISVEGLSLPTLGLGPAEQLIPTKVTLTPNMDSVPVDAFRRIIVKLVQKQDPADEDVTAVFAKGPVTAGLDNLLVDVAGSTITGNGKLLLTSPELFSGTGQITAENLDRLQQALASNPTTAQGAPVLIFLKGIGRTEQSRTVWDIVFRDNKLLVNGQDLAMLMGAMNGQPAPAPRQAPRQAPRKQ